MSEKSSIFDMIGPVMVGPSSSHTAGVVRIGRTAYKILGDVPEQAEITFFNSFARTFEGHGSDRAILAGLMDFATDDLRIREALDIAKKAGIQFEFKPVSNASTMHPNTVKLKIKKADKEAQVIGESLGGGVIRIVNVDGFPSSISAQQPTLIIKASDTPGTIAFLADVIAHDGCNIATMSSSRRAKNDMACHFIEMDSPLKPITLEYLKSVDVVKDVIYFTGID
jgi:L-serine dehydratase